MALIRGATRRADWVVALRVGTGGAALAVTLIGELRPLLLVAAVAALVVLETVIELRGAPAGPLRERPVLPHEIARRRGSG